MNSKNTIGDNMRKVLVLVLVSLIVLLTMPLIFTNVALANATDAGYINITADEAKQMIDENQRIVILDAQTVAEYKSGHIDGSKLIPLLELEERINAIDGNSAVIVYCRSGVKSEKASELLLDHGFDKVYNIMGGLNAWQDAGFPVVSSSTANQIPPSNDSLSSEIDDILSSGKPVFLFLYVDWCHFCQQQIPIIDELEQEYAENITFLRVNCEMHLDAMTDLEARGYPSMFLILRKGEDGQYESQYFKGFTDKETLKEIIDWIIASGSVNENSKGNELWIGVSPTLLIYDEKYSGRIFPLSAASAGLGIDPKTDAQELPSLNHESGLLEFSLKSEKAIIGRYPDFDVSFSSVLERDDYVIVDIRLSDKRQLIAQINYMDETFQIQFISLENGQLVKLTKGDFHTFYVLHSNLLRHFPTLNMPKVVDPLLSTLNLLESYPPNELFNVSKGIEETSARGIESLCNYIGDEIAGYYTLPADATVCLELENCYFDVSSSTCVCTEVVILGPCNDGDCIGRCGAGCGSIDKPSKYQIFTQDCLNHDLCRAATGQNLGPCADEFAAAVDDYSWGHNCAKDAAVLVEHVSSGSGCDTEVPVKFKVKNTGNFYDRYNLAATCSPWSCDTPSSVGPIAASCWEFVTVDVSVSEGDECTGSVKLTATSQCNPDVSDFVEGSFTLCKCCPEGSPNEGTCYTPGTPQDGCCEYSGSCRSGNLDPEECRVCYGGIWSSGEKCCDDGNCHECCTDADCQEGYICNPETHECEEEVPEFPAGVTAVFGATLFIFLMMRRKYIRK